MEVTSLPSGEIDRPVAAWPPDLLDEQTRRVFDQLAAMAARLFDAPVAMLCVGGVGVVWTDPSDGLDAEAVKRDPCLCGSSVQGDGPWLIEDASVDPRTREHPLVVGDFGLRFYFGVPLRGRDGEPFGAVCVVDRRPHHPPPRRVTALLDLAAMAAEQFELHTRVHADLVRERKRRVRAEHLARTLERSLRPATLLRVPGLDLATRYRPADGGLVGGDFYDVLPAQDSWGLVIGDVRGHGAPAAALTATARHTLATLTRDAWSPAQSLARLNETIQRAGERERDPELFCTAALVRVDRRERGVRATLALAGHPRPYVLRAGGEVHAVGTPGTALGLTATPSVTEVEVDLEPGDALVMYTDGVTDTRTETDQFDDAALRALLATTRRRPAGEIAAAVEQAVVDLDPDPDDDTAVFVARVTDQG